MTQEQINDAEWNNDDNWGGTGGLANLASVYFSKKDTRTWVPKKSPTMGWTVNMAHNTGVAWFLGILLGIPLIFVIILIGVTH